MPEDTNSVLICVATGTGIAPFRSFWRRCFYEDVPNYKFTGLFWLFMGVANSDAKLYDDEISDMAATYPANFRVEYALSREQNNVRGGKMYIQDKVEEYADEVFDLLDNGAHIFFCGLKVRERRDEGRGAGGVLGGLGFGVCVCVESVDCDRPAKALVLLIGVTQPQQHDPTTTITILAAALLTPHAPTPTHTYLLSLPTTCRA
jgi:hypothetical protein